MGSEKPTNLPHWKTSNIYPGLESQALAGDIHKLEDPLTDLEVFVEQQLSSDRDRLPVNAREAATALPASESRSILPL